MSLGHTNSDSLQSTETMATDAPALRWYTALAEIPNNTEGTHRTLADRGHRDSDSPVGLWTTCRELGTMVVGGYVTVVGEGVEWRYIVHRDHPSRA